jgi:hypothetical protein
LKILSGSADAGGSGAETNWGSEMDIQCHFEGDLPLPRYLKATKTYTEAIEFARNFTQILTDSFAKTLHPEKSPSAYLQLFGSTHSD